MAIRSINFYKMIMRDLNSSRKLKNKEAATILLDIVDKNSIKTSDYESLDISIEKDMLKTIIDVFNRNETNSNMFCRLSKQKPSNNFIKREYTNYQNSDIEKDILGEKDGIEQFTYAYINLDTMICAYLGSNVAPTEKAFAEMVRKYNKTYALEIQPIPNANGIDRFMKGNDPEIKKLEIEVPRPNMNALINLLGWNVDIAEEYTYLDKNIKATVMLGPDCRNGYLAKDEKTKSIMNNILGNKSKYNKAKLKGKIDTENLREYSFFEENFTYHVDIPTYKIENKMKKFYSVEEQKENCKDHLIMAMNANDEILKIYK